MLNSAECQALIRNAMEGRLTAIRYENAVLLNYEKLKPLTLVVLGGVLTLLWRMQFRLVERESGWHKVLDWNSSSSCVAPYQGLLLIASSKSQATLLGRGSSVRPSSPYEQGCQQSKTQRGGEQFLASSSFVLCTLVGMHHLDGMQVVLPTCCMYMLVMGTGIRPCKRDCKQQVCGQLPSPSCQQPLRA